MPATQIEQGSEARQQDFPIDSFNFLEDRLRLFRLAVMRQAAALAAKEQTSGDLYRVERRHILQALTELLKDSAPAFKVMQLRYGED